MTLILLTRCGARRGDAGILRGMSQDSLYFCVVALLALIAIACPARILTSAAP